jgi:predicted DNA-binding ribbon-helix-helix protein
MTTNGPKRVGLTVINMLLDFLLATLDVAFTSNIRIAGHKTSVSLEDAFWKALKSIAKERDMKLPDLVTSIDSARQHSNLSSAIRLYVLNYYQSALTSPAGSRSQHIMQPGQREP